MESAKVIRKIDELGRIVLPIETRKSLNLKEKDSVEISVFDGGIFLKPTHTQYCTFCEGENDLIEHGKKYICKTCLAEINGHEATIPAENP